ncbi:hypothetical protein F8O01_16525 [Pseudoclavibacter chungangensis]|uniref:Uncharacterized protein n=1 Tax=Pseudoclavibacter chungangensis TaxID=587635 RepID=A0A7J5BMQ1_9MICO|nr:hypothetical protein [Pseudoclavibacter chungangensis]KAB1652637.1 hypothetical protein F8O01_16525 [Pseudoclavibacter chungangensis]NYJ68360.1 hypothetical protein [Pseudoclavibacter chungangensis]
MTDDSPTPAGPTRSPGADSTGTSRSGGEGDTARPRWFRFVVLLPVVAVGVALLGPLPAIPAVALALVATGFGALLGLSTRFGWSARRTTIVVSCGSLAVVVVSLALAALLGA